MEHQLVNLITEYDLTATADAGDFAAITIAAHAQSVITPRPDLVGAKETLTSLLTAGYDAPAITAAMRADSLGSEVMEALHVSGVDWGDPLTQGILGVLIDPSGPITQAVADTLTSLSVVVTSPAQDAGVPADADAVDFGEAWAAKQAAEVVQANQEIGWVKAGAVQEAAAQVVATIEADHTLSLADAITAISAALTTQWEA